MTTVAIAAVTAMALVALALWWIRRTNPAMVAVSGGASCGSCDGLPARQLFFAAAAEPGGGAGAAGPGGAAVAGGGPPKRRKRTGPSRRAFLRTSMGVGFLGVLGGFGGATLQFLWPDLRGGFGAVIDAGTEDEILEYIRGNREPYEFAPARTYFVAYDGGQDPDGQYDEITDGQQAQVMALYWRCVHLGCKVPWCHSSQWLECPCHGSRYNRWGEWQGGPAPRGLDRFAVEIRDGHVFVDTSAVITGPTRQSPALDQLPEGPTCT
jgi:cytochrome b6-f complex iron-sulfur subunit